MTKLRGKQKNNTKGNRSGLVSAVILSAVFVSFPAWSQNNGDGVSVDLSVLNDGGGITSNSVPSYMSTQKLLLPPRQRPVSKLYIAPSNAPKLVQPTRRPKITPKKIAKSAPKKMPASATVSAPAPAAQVSKAPPPAPSIPAPAEKIALKTDAPPAIKKDAPPAIAPAPPAAPKILNTSKAPPPPPTVASAPKPAKALKSANTENAAGGIKPGQSTRIIFSGSATKIPGSAKDRLRGLADGVRDKSDFRLQLMAYAGAEGLSASKARRMSLSRALSIRSFLIENGVRSTRIDVRALGNKTSEKPVNRVDINVAKR